MVQTSLNAFDLAVLIVIGLSALLSFFRGFARELISIFSWAGAALVTLYAFPTVSKWLEPQVKSPMIANGLASIGVFVVALITITILSGILIKFIKPSKEIGFIDNMLGLCFGVARGVLIVSIGYFIMTIVIAPPNYPDWVKTAYTRPYVEEASHYIAKITPAYIDDAVKDSKKAIDDHSSQPVFDTNSKAMPSKDEVKKTLDLPSFEELQKRVRSENEGK